MWFLFIIMALFGAIAGCLGGSLSEQSQRVLFGAWYILFWVSGAFGLWLDARKADKQNASTR